MDFLRNNLITASNPYLRQHKDNPVWWQEWNPQTLDYAREQDKPLLVSVGYSTCHWCHVMAQEAFSDAECAEILNREFVCIKIDREQRPDIDQYLMSFLVATTGSGGWPLNAFLTPDGHPFFAMTYASTEARFQTPAFSDILRQVGEFYDKRRDDIRPFEVVPNGPDAGEPQATAPVLANTDPSDDDELAGTVGDLQRAFDRGFGGFGSSLKFPPHSALLFMLYAAAGAGDGPGKALLAMATETLDAMMTRGLHDHLQGGFFRYCVDRNWTIPHFEKMLYDQAMLLWNYSLAARLTGTQGYRTTAEGIFRSLEETFRIGNLYAAAHDADTDHHEGETHLWSLKEVTAALNEAERDALLRVYDVSQSGNFEGKNHLVRRLAPGYENDPGVPRHRRPHPAALRSAQGKLLAIRRSRPQPFRDEKLLTAWNALAGCGLVAAHRYLGMPGALERAAEIARSLLHGFTDARRLAHAATNDAQVDGERDDRQSGEFLSDYASLLLLLSMLGEEISEFEPGIRALTSAMLRFRRDGHWFESDNDDFRPIPAQTLDQPVPSGMALTQAVLLRQEIAGHVNTLPQAFANPLAHGFRNVSALMSRGYFHVVGSPEPVSWDRLPVNTVQIRGRNSVSCYRGVCYQGLPERVR